MNALEKLNLVTANCGWLTNSEESTKILQSELRQVRDLCNQEELLRKKSNARLFLRSNEFGSVTKIVNLLHGGLSDKSLFPDGLNENNKLGFWAQFKTPVVRKQIDKLEYGGENNLTETVVNHIISDWMYGDTFEEVAELGLKWANDVFKSTPILPQDDEDDFKKAMS